MAYCMIQLKGHQCFDEILSQKAVFGEALGLKVVFLVGKVERRFLGEILGVIDGLHNGALVGNLNWKIGFDSIVDGLLVGRRDIFVGKTVEASVGSPDGTEWWSDGCSDG